MKSTKGVRRRGRRRRELRVDDRRRTTLKRVDPVRPPRPFPVRRSPVQCSNTRLFLTNQLRFPRPLLGGTLPSGLVRGALLVFGFPGQSGPYEGRYDVGKRSLRAFSSCRRSSFSESP